MPKKLTLKPCPFCGKNPDLNHHESQHYGNDGKPYKDCHGYSICCEQCNLMFGTDNDADYYGDTIGDFPTKEQAVKAWNFRIDEAVF